MQGSSNLEELKDKIGEYMLSKTKLQCIEDIKKKKREFMSIDVGKGAHDWYKKEILEVARIYHEKGTNSDGAKQEALLGALNKVKICCSKSKIDAAVSLTEEILMKEDAVVLFTSFVFVAKSLKGKFQEMDLEAEIMTGDTK